MNRPAWQSQSTTKSLFNYLEGIKTEVRDITLYLEKDFPEDRLAVKTVTWQCQRLVEAVEGIINKLREETFTHQQDGHKIFKQVIYVLEEVRNSLKQVTLYHDITNVQELRKHFIVCIRTVYEHIENLVQLTYTYYPEFRYTLKYILVDFMTTLHGIRSHFLHLNTEFHTKFQTVQSPRLLIKDIHEYTCEFTEIFKEFTHPTQVKVALRGYLLYVNEIVRKLEEENVFGHKELDVVVHELCNKLREIVYPLMEIMNETTIDMKLFRTKIVTKCFEVVSIFEQLVQLCEDKVLPVEVREFLIRIIYQYSYAIKHVSYEVKFGYKIGFYMPKYYTPEYYGKHGYGLYEKEFHHRFFTPSTYETKYTIPQEFRSFEERMFSPYRYETLFPEHKYEGLFPEHKYYNQRFFGKSLGRMESYGKSFKGMKYDYETPEEFVSTIHMLVKRVFERFEHNTFETKNYEQVIIYEIREFLEVLEWIYEKFEKTVTLEHELYSDKLVKEVFFNLKQIKTELKEIVSTGIFTNIHEIKIRFLRYIEVVATELTKLFEKYEVPQFERVLIKDICIRFITFLHKVCYEPTTYTHEFFPVNEFTEYSQKYFKGMKYDYETPKEFVNTIHMLVKRVFERFEHNTFETKNYEQVIIYQIREFLEVLEWICEKFEKTVTLEHELYSDKLVKEVFFNLKQIKTELKEIVSTGVFTNIHEIKIRLLRYIEVVATELTKLFEKYEVPEFERVLIKDICIRFITFLHKVCYEPTTYTHEFFPVNEFTEYSQKYFKGMKYDYETPKEFVNTIHMLVKRVFERFEYNTFETKNYEQVIIYQIREFLEVLEWICEKFEKTVTFEHELYSDKLVKEVFFNLKQIKTELKEIVSTGVFTNIHEIKIRFLRYIEVVATELTKLFEKYEVPEFERVLIKDICIRFITFLHKIYYEYNTYSSEFFPRKDFTQYLPTEKYLPTVYSRWLKY